MKKRLFAAAVTLLVAAQGAAAQEKRAQISGDELNYLMAMVNSLDAAENNPAPDFTVARADAKGGMLKLSDLRGKVVLVNFWATWCPPCRAELRHMVRSGLLARLTKNPDFVFLPVSKENKATVVQFLAQNEYTFATYVDPSGGDIATLYGVTGIPTNFLVGRDGSILYKAVGFSDDIDKGLLDAIDRALAEGKTRK